MKSIGYLISIISVVLLGVVAWPKLDEPGWKATALIVGIRASVIGMVLRYLAHAGRRRPVTTLPAVLT